MRLFGQTKCDNTFDVSVYRKPTHSDRYLNFYSAHPVHMKKAIIKSLVFRAERLCSEDSTKTSEINHLRCVLKQNSYPQKFIDASINSERPSRNTTEEKKTSVATILIPYRQRTSELIRKVLSDYDIRTVFRPDNTLAKHLVHAKDPIITEEQTDCIYEIKCADCDAVYIGETSRQLKVRLSEHKRYTKLRTTSPSKIKKLEHDSAIALHAIAEGHQLQFDQTKVLQSGLPCFAERCCAEALAIQSQPACVNRNDSRNLSAIWLGLNQNVKRALSMTSR